MAMEPDFAQTIELLPILFVISWHSSVVELSIQIGADRRLKQLLICADKD